MFSPLSNLLQKEMDRKEFLKHVGVAMLMVAGGGLLVQSLQNTGKLKLSESAGPAPTYGYGASLYGGRSNSI
jgi:hypothetical protein